MIVHLKSGGEPPQQEEVNALEQFIRQQQAAGSQNLVLCGDWNIRPDRGQGRGRLEQLRAPGSGGPLMHVLTVDHSVLSLGDWSSLEQRGLLAFDDPVSRLVPFSHFNPSSLDTFLDHIALSTSFHEIFDDPIEVTLADGTVDRRSGIRVALPARPESQFNLLTDHLPIVLTLRTSGQAPAVEGTGLGLRIAASIPNPVGVDEEGEEVWIRNDSASLISLAGWGIGDDDGTAVWQLTAADGTATPGQVVRVVRNGRPMNLGNTGDRVRLLDPDHNLVDERVYGHADSGAIFQFNRTGAQATNFGRRPPKRPRPTAKK
jgi:hypothetical protein